MQKHVKDRAAGAIGWRDERSPRWGFTGCFTDVSVKARLWRFALRDKKSASRLRRDMRKEHQMIVM